MNIYDVEFELTSGFQGRAVVKATSTEEVKMELNKGLVKRGFSIDGGDFFDIIEIDIFKEEGPKVAVIGIEKVEKINRDILHVKDI